MTLTNPYYTNRQPPSRITVPENIERRDYNGPCFYCERREGCSHRPRYVSS